LIGDPERPSVKDENIAALEKIAEDLRDKIAEERFIFSVLALIFADAHIFSHMASWGGPVAILVLEVVVLVVLARRCGVQDVQRLMDRILEGWSSHNRSK
jgi:hypothetical protein